MEGLSNLGINGYSILIYLVNFGLLISVLTYFLYRPVLGFLDQRRQHIKDKIHEADKIKDEFAQKLKEMEAAKEAAQVELQHELEQMKKYVDQKRTELVTEMEKEREVLLTKANAEIDKRKNELVSDVEKSLLVLMKKIVLEIVHNKVPEDVIQSSVNDAWKTYTK
ncbi:hypothetical protein COV81_03205 [Candidatus Peregrinibacteria bacterium CG11_big_fil_rev_8_21_14_0_20_41_10]|nr:MAG: hypothetical protein COV81_03205 [Candidatus Peregrinibacteria bacterium CG11_big_fil_rev_8_21_14_0_20_41_10]